MIEIGKEHVFFYRCDSDDAECLCGYNGKKCTVLHDDTRLGVTADIQNGGLFEVQFPGDANTYNVYGKELVPLSECDGGRFGIYWVKEPSEYEKLQSLRELVCAATQLTNYKCENICKEKGSCAYCFTIAERILR